MQRLLCGGLLLKSPELAIAYLAHQAVDVASPGTMAGAVDTANLSHSHTALGSIFGKNLSKVIYTRLLALVLTLATTPHNAGQIISAAGRI